MDTQSSYPTPRDHQDVRSGTAETRPVGLSRADSMAGYAALAATRASWPPVRQPHRDDVDYLRGFLRSRGLRQVEYAEPATPARLQQLLRRAGISQTKAERAVGCTLEKLIERNPGVALWHLTATTLEASA